jgi:hypothetical protein
LSSRAGVRDSWACAWQRVAGRGCRQAGGRLLSDGPSAYGPAASGSHGSPAVSLVSTSAGGCPCLRAVDR